MLLLEGGGGGCWWLYSPQHCAVLPTIPRPLFPVSLRVYGAHVGPTRPSLSLLQAERLGRRLEAEEDDTGKSERV